MDRAARIGIIRLLRGSAVGSLSHVPKEGLRI